MSALLWAGLAAWAAIGATAAAIAVSASALPRRRRDSGGLEALVEATREEHPRFSDWDIRELSEP